MNHSTLDEMESIGKSLIEHAAADHDGFVPSSIIGYRDDKPVVVIGAMPDRDLMLFVCHVLVVALDVSRIEIYFDTYTTSSETNPLTGERWKSGEMAEYVSLCRADQDIDETAVLDALVVAIVEPCRFDSRIIKYRIRDDGTARIASSTASGDGFDGLVVRALLDMMSHEVRMDISSFGDGGPNGRLMADMVTIAKMQETLPISIVIPADNEKVTDLMRLSNMSN